MTKTAGTGTMSKSKISYKLDDGTTGECEVVLEDGQEINAGDDLFATINEDGTITLWRAEE